MLPAGIFYNPSYATNILVFTPWFFTFALHFNSHFPGGPGLAGTRMSPCCILSELRMTEMVVTTGAIRPAKLQTKCHHQQSDTEFLFTGWMPFLSPNKQCQGTEGIKTNTVVFTMWLLLIVANCQYRHYATCKVAATFILFGLTMVYGGHCM